MKEAKYIHLLTYNQDFMVMEYGLCELYYKIQEQKLYLLKIDHQEDTVKERIISYNLNLTTVDAILTYFLKELFFKDDFFGEGRMIYEKSEQFSEDYFISIQNERNEEYVKKIKFIEESNKHNDLINFCRTINLNPIPDGIHASNWIANCLSKGNHQMLLTTLTNEWGCGYCRKKGGLPELKEWYFIQQ
jgi:hypothetical protein